MQKKSAARECGAFSFCRHPGAGRDPVARCCLQAKSAHEAVRENRTAAPLDPGLRRDDEL
jgi:hypothetical protein